MDSKPFNELAASLAAPAPGQAYALVDGALCTDLRLRAPLGVDVARLPVPGIGDEASMAALPMLMAWPDDAGLRDWLLQRTMLWAEERHAATWLRSSAGLQALAHRLGLGIAALLDDGTEVLLRVADARVLPAMHDALEPAQRGSLFGCIQDWWYVDREETLQSLPMDSGPATSAPPAASFPLTLTQSQLDSLLQAAEPDFVMQLLRDSYPGTLDRLPRARRHAFVRRQIDAAQSWGLERVNDLASFCVLVLQHGEDFADRLAWQGLRERVRSGRMSWLEALAQGERT